MKTTSKISEICDKVINLYGDEKFNNTVKFFDAGEFSFVSVFGKQSATYKGKEITEEKIDEEEKNFFVNLTPEILDELGVVLYEHRIAL